MKRIVYRDSSWFFPFVAYVPESIPDRLPLILQLHGAGESGLGREDLDRVDIHGFSDLLGHQEYPCMFVMPQCRPDTFWVAEIPSVLSFLQQLKQSFSIDPDRVYLTGLSMGGYGTWYTAQARPDLFAAIAPVCGGGMAWKAGALTMPVWAFHGTEDQAVNVFHSDEMVEKLRRCGGTVRYTRVEGCGHNVWEYAYNDTLARWLLDQKRK